MARTVLYFNFHLWLHPLCSIDIMLIILYFPLMLNNMYVCALWCLHRLWPTHGLHTFYRAITRCTPPDLSQSLTYSSTGSGSSTVVPWWTADDLTRIDTYFPRYNIVYRKYSQCAYPLLCHLVWGITQKPSSYQYAKNAFRLFPR